jgi:hypothetical protein
MKIPKPKNLKVEKIFNSHTLNEILPYLPNETCFFDTRHWVCGTDILPFSVTTRISSNNQQFLKEIYETERDIWPLAEQGQDRQGGETHLNPYVNCLHTQVGSARDNMEVYVIEIYDGQEAYDPAPKSGGVFHGQ